MTVGDLMKRVQRRGKGGILAAVGYVLSPFSWWNDAYVNLPIAYVAAWCVSRFDRALFETSFIAAYWLTNLAGLLMLHSGVRQALSREEDPERRHRQEILIDILVSLLYTVLVLLLFKTGVIRPVEFAKWSVAGA